MPIVSLSGVRGVFNEDLPAAELVRYVRSFAKLCGSRELLLASDTRRTGEAIGRMVASAILRDGHDVIDYGIVSTPALFRESRKRAVPAVMVTASHNPPEWNGLKFIRSGVGITQKEFEGVLEATRFPQQRIVSGRTRRATSSYNEDAIGTANGASGAGIDVVLDLGGGSAIMHAPAVLRSLGCTVHSLADTPGLFERTIDPTADPLVGLSKAVRGRSAHVGFAFDCDGDRLVVVDDEGRRRSGDFMLTMALTVALSERPGSNVAVSVDTTQAVDEVVGKAGGKVHRTPVGEANVVQGMTTARARFGGEGSSGGFIDAEFNNCRDSMVAAIMLVRGLKLWGRSFYDRTKTYHQTRLRLEVPRKKAAAAIRRLARESPDAETLDGVKVRTSNSSWVLVRASGTEEIMRVSAEARSKKEADELARIYAQKAKRLSE